MVYAKLPSPSEPTAPVDTVSASGRRFISSETSARARIKLFLGIGQVDLGAACCGLGIETPGEAGYLADERLTVEARRLDDGRIADVKLRYVVLRDVAKHPDRIDPLHREKCPSGRRRPCGRGCLDQIAAAHRAPRRHAIERRHDLRIGEQSLDLLHGRGGATSTWLAA